MAVAPTPTASQHGIRWLVFLLIVTIGVGAYLWLATARWQRSSADWEVKARAHAAEVASLRMRLNGANTELKAARNQLSTATDRITDLADEKAQLSDENVASQRYLDYQTQISEAAATVASALGQCVSGQGQLVGYLKTADEYGRADLLRYEQQVEALCYDAEQANDALQRELSS